MHQPPQPGHQTPPQQAPPQYGQRVSPQAQPVAAQAAPGFVQFTVQGSVWTSSMIAPQVTFNGYPVVVMNHGTAMIPVQPGTYVINVQNTWMWTFGRAALQVDVLPGQSVPVFYGGPYVSFERGELGVVPQQRRGLGWLIGLSVLPIAVAVGAVSLLIATALM